jgi:TspO/MBR family
VGAARIDLRSRVVHALRAYGRLGVARLAQARGYATSPAAIRRPACRQCAVVWLFFARHQGALAFIDVLVLLLLIAATIVSFWRLNPVAAVILVPYILWVGFAFVLTWAIWRGNPSVL